MENSSQHRYPHLGKERAIAECKCTLPEHYLIPRHNPDHSYDPTRPAQGCRAGLRELLAIAEVKVRRYDFRHHAISRALSNPMVSANGGTPQPLLPGNPDEGDPNWSPDGNSVVFFAANDRNSGAINVLDLRTHSVSVIPGSDGFYSPHWSPDGRYIAALSGDAQKLMLFDFKTQKWGDLATTTAAFPNWSRDGSHLYFHSFGRDPAIYRVRISDHKLEKIVSLKGLRLTIGDFGSWCGLAPDDSPLELRDVGSQEIYALDLQLP